MKHLSYYCLAGAVLVVACSGETAPSLGHGGIPPVNLATRVNPGQGPGGAGGNGGVGGAGGSRGACDNPTDEEALAAVNSTGITSFCGGVFCIINIGAPGLYAQCVAQCVEERTPALSTECAECYGDLAACGLSAFCLSVCQFNTCDLRCQNCFNFAECLGPFERCRGIPGNGCSDTGGVPFIPPTDNQ